MNRRPGSVTWLRSWLHQWAAWHMAQHGYPDSSPEWRAAHAVRADGSPQSMPPNGAEIPAALVALHSALQELAGDRVLGVPIHAMRLCYLHHPAKAAEMLDISRAKAFVLRQQGELALLAYFKAGRA
jgi:hypothetical protein